MRAGNCYNHGTPNVVYIIKMGQYSLDLLYLQNPGDEIIIHIMYIFISFSRHRWNHLLVSYRTRNLYGHHTDFRPTIPPHRPRGRELTCIGRVTLPDSLPSGEFTKTNF